MYRQATCPVAEHRKKLPVSGCSCRCQEKQLDQLARSVVMSVIYTRDESPDMTALEVLDASMAGYNECSPDFSNPTTEDIANWRDWSGSCQSAIDPGTPLGEILRDAFAPQLTEASLSSFALSGPDSDIRETWHALVVAPFGMRYRLRHFAALRKPWEEDFVAQLLRRWPETNPDQAAARARTMRATQMGQTFAPEMAADWFVRDVESQDMQERPNTLFMLSVDRRHRRAHPEASVAAVAAAATVFQAAAIAPMRALRSTMTIRSWWETTGGDPATEPPKEVMEAHRVWLEAESAASEGYRAVSGNVEAYPVLLLDFEDKL
jgi:hypothetical protein